MAVTLTSKISRMTSMAEAALENRCCAYIACLNRQDRANLGQFVSDNARHDGRPAGRRGCFSGRRS